MNFFQAVGAGLRGYFTVSGRASRSEFWWWALFSLLVQLAVLLVGMAGVAHGPYGGTLGLVYLLSQVAFFIPQITLTTRRLHDIEKRGWWQLIGFVPLIGGLLLLWWMLRRGDIGRNRFGDDPLGPADAPFVGLSEA